MTARWPRAAAGLAGTLALLTLSGCGLFSSPAPAAAGGARASAPAGHPGGTVSCPARAAAPKFPCAIQRGIAAAERYMRGQPGTMGIVLEDRANGAIWRDGASVLLPAASTMKLALMTDLLLRAQPGHPDHILLSPADKREMREALNVSDDTAATDLWNAFEKDDPGGFLSRIRRQFHMGTCFYNGMRVWGFMNCSPRDLLNVMDYVLAKAPASVRGYLVDQLRHVSKLDQQWGVWGAGPENQPGNKDGWENDPWVTDTVGFAGPGERYTLAIMYELAGARANEPRGFQFGANQLTQIASLIFQGHRTAVPHPEMSPKGVD